MYGLADVAGSTAGLIAAGVEASTPSVNADYPGYCGWLPFGEYLTACQVPTAAVQNAAIKRDIDKAAGGDTVLADQQYAAYLADITALAKIDPEGAAEYNFAGQNPNQAALLGAGPFGRLAAGTWNLGVDVTSWAGVPAWVWLAGGIGVLGLVAISGGSPRRYGR